MNTKFEVRNPKYETNSNNKISNSKHYDLEERTFEFARDCRAFIKKLTKTIGNIEDGKQLVRSSGSMGANYIEANEAISKKDFVLRVRISRKESKESGYWLRLVEVGDLLGMEKERERLIDEASQLMMVFSAIMRKTQ